MAKVTINLSEMDLDDLPMRKSVYAIFARHKDSGKPINCRYVGETDNLEERTKAHFSETEQNEKLREFMQSTSMKMMIYELLPDSTKADRLVTEKEWIAEYRPQYNIKDN